jgi:hypothetical protein
MDEQQRARNQRAALDWINARWTNPDKRCPICTQNTWTVGAVFEVREFEGGNLVLGGNNNIIPMFPVACTTCGHVYWFNALLTGVVQPPAQENPEDSAEPGAK